jgi:hypothetical protein
MSLGRSVNLIRAGVVWRALGSPGAGAKLVEAMTADDEQERMLAGMSLVKAGERSLDLIHDAYAAGNATPQMVRLIADIGGPRSRPMLAEMAAEPGPLADAATDALNLLDRIDRLDEID